MRIRKDLVMLKREARGSEHRICPRCGHRNPGGGQAEVTVADERRAFRHRCRRCALFWVNAYPVNEDGDVIKGRVTCPECDDGTT